MTNPFRTRSATNLGLALARLPLGGQFVLGSVQKLFNVGVGRFVRETSGLLPDFLPRPIGQTYLYFLPFVEMLVGVCLLLGFFTRTAALLASLMLISFMIALPPLVHTDTLVLNANLAYLSLALVTLFTGGGNITVDRAMFGPQDDFIG